uniref:Uncharacterized protein n=1 Tax=Aegilops tauschii subsp. strangulata TaxID=200361 RepID=A0A453NDD5_AEGTS
MQPLSHSHRNGFPVPFFGLALVLLVCLDSPTSSCTDQEKSSLLQLLTGLSSDGGLTASWRIDTDCCTWEGITCNQDRIVTDVSLASRGLKGSISPFLGNLTGLLRLNLSQNSLSGGLPLELVSSSSILVLDVSFNCLTGGLSELPSSTPARPLQVMKSLVVLNASTNSFTGQIPTTPCVSAPSFAVLELSFNQLSGNIPPGLGNCLALKLLSAGYNNLNGTLPDELFKVRSLQYISLPNNRLEGALNGIINLTNLVTLDLGKNELSGNIPDSIGELKRLEEIHLGHNNMSGELPSALSNCTKSIYSCSKLTALRLSYNHFHGQLSEKIGNLKSLRFLSLVNLSLTNIKRTLQILESSRSLNTLFIEFNFLHETMPEDDSIDGFENLQVLSMSYCSMSGTIPDWLSKLTNLGMLFLQGNQLTGPIPDWISTLNFLFHLDISNNSFTGEISTALAEMPMLKSDKIAAKAFFELPVYVFSPFIQYINAGACPKVLNLAVNKFTGVIPGEMGQLRALVSLNLSYNKLSGEIPQPICNLTNLQMLDLSSNHLTGTILAALNNLHFLSKFNISDNDLEGPIPTVGQLSTFPDSSFDGNPKLCGPMIVNHCGSAEAGPESIISREQIGIQQDHVSGSSAIEQRRTHNKQNRQSTHKQSAV